MVFKRLIYFLEDGIFVWVILDCIFKEWKEFKKEKKIVNFIDDLVRIVKRGEILSSIVIEEFGDFYLWCIIVEENCLINFCKIVLGKVLIILFLKMKNII